MLLLAFAGRARGGKDTACTAIIERCSYVGISCGYYSISEQVLGYCIEHGILPPKLRGDLSPEELDTLVRVGFEQRRADPEFWLRRIEDGMAADKPKVALIPNARYRNEAEWIKARSGRMIKVVRLNENCSQYISQDRPPNHISETDLEYYPSDYILVAKTGQAWWLRRQAVSVFEEIWEENTRQAGICAQAIVDGRMSGGGIRFRLR